MCMCVSGREGLREEDIHVDVVLSICASSYCYDWKAGLRVRVCHIIKCNTMKATASYLSV